MEWGRREGNQHVRTLEQFSKCRGGFWLAGAMEYELWHSRRGHESASYAVARIVHAGRTGGRERCRNGANPSNGKPQNARINLNNIATEFPALQGFDGSGVDFG